MQVYGISKAET